MNCFHGIQQSRELAVNPSMSWGSSTGRSYEGDADDDSFESCSSTGKLSSDIPKIHSSSTIGFMPLKNSMKSTSSESSLDYSLKTDEDSDCFTLPTFTSKICNNTRTSNSRGSPTLVTNAFEKNNEVFQKDKQYQQLMSEPPSLASSLDTKTTVETIHSPFSSSSESPITINIASPPAIRYQLRTEVASQSSSKYEPSESMRGNSRQSPAAAIFLPSYLGSSENNHSPLSFSQERSYLLAQKNFFPKTHGKHDTVANSAFVTTKPNRVEALKERLRSMEKNHGQTSNRSTFKPKENVRTSNEIKTSVSFSNHQGKSLRLAREIMALAFTSYIIFLGFLSHRDAQANSLQLQMANTDILEHAMTLTRDHQIRTLQMQQELTTILDQTFALLEEQLKENSSTALEPDEQERSSNSTPKSFQDYPNETTSTAQEEQRQIGTGERNKIKIPMNDFYILQSMLD